MTISEIHVSPGLVTFLTADRVVSSLVPRLREATMAVAITAFLTVVASADIALQDWIPSVLDMPDDAEIVADRQIGSTIRMFSFSTQENGADLLREWQQTLQDNGYIINSARDDLIENAVEFSGNGINNAKILATSVAGEAGNQTLIEFDATLQ